MGKIRTQTGSFAYARYQFRRSVLEMLSKKITTQKTMRLLKNSLVDVFFAVLNKLREETT